MIQFLVDADLPRSVARTLRHLGYTTDDVRDLGLGSATDEAILRYATGHRYTLISGDKGFSNTLRFPPGSHHGIILLRFPPHTPAHKKAHLLLRWIPTLQEADLPGNLLIIQSKGIRIRRARA